MLSAYTANSFMCSVVAGCGYMRLVTTVDYSLQVLYERCTPENKAQIHLKSCSGN